MSRRHLEQTDPEGLVCSDMAEKKGVWWSRVPRTIRDNMKLCKGPNAAVCGAIAMFAYLEIIRDLERTRAALDLHSQWSHRGRYAPDSKRMNTKQKWAGFVTRS